jgi:hypothetical protein
VSSPATALPAWFAWIKSNHRPDTRVAKLQHPGTPRCGRERRTTLTKGRLDLHRIALATALAAGLGVGLAFAFLRHAQATSHVGPSSATLDEAFSSFLGAGIGLALGSALGALSIRRGSLRRPCHGHLILPIDALQAARRASASRIRFRVPGLTASSDVTTTFPNPSCSIPWVLAY